MDRSPGHVEHQHSGKGTPMNWDKPKPLGAARVGRPALVPRAAAVAAAGVLLTAGCSSAAAGQNAASTSGTASATVALSAASGSTGSTPTWSTSAACPNGYQGSAIFREIHPDGTTNDISPAVTGPATPFHGTLQATIAQIQAAGSVPNGGTQEFVILCFAGQSLTGKYLREMHLFIHYSADGKSYTTSPAS
jgi:hypothetical protein